MADIFLSYAEEDRDTARKVARALESAGWSVWWDRKIPAGKTWREVIEAAVEAMRCMLVLWSRHSVKSAWVLEEAEEARARGKFLPILIECVTPPLGFRSVQAADLTDWTGAPETPGFQALIQDLGTRIGMPSPPDSPADPLGPTEGQHDVPGPADGDRALRHRYPAQLVAAVGVLAVATLAVAAVVWRNPGDVPAPPLAAPMASGSTAPMPSGPQAPAPSNASPTSITAEPNPPQGVPRVAADKPIATTPNTAVVKPVGAGPKRPRPSERCNVILERSQLGELSADDRSFLQKECKP